MSNAPIAIIGMACIFPQAPDLAAFWRNILAGADAVGEPQDEWEAQRYLDSGRINTQHGGYLNDLYRFDPLREFNSDGLACPGFHPVERFETRQFFAWLLGQEALGSARALAAFRLEKAIALDRYRRWRAYGDSKMANLMFGKELADRLTDRYWDDEGKRAESKAVWAAEDLRRIVLQKHFRLAGLAGEGALDDDIAALVLDAELGRVARDLAALVNLSFQRGEFILELHPLTFPCLARPPIAGIPLPNDVFRP